MRHFKIYRFDPDSDAAPRMQTYDLEIGDGERMLLDALIRLKALDPSLSFRRSSREGICGSDAMNINGKNGLACITNMRTLPSTAVLKPLPGLPVIRDLFVDMTGFFMQYHSIKPWLVNDDPPPEKERLQSPRPEPSCIASFWARRRRPWSLMRRSAGTVAHRSRQARSPAKALPAGIDAASMGRPCLATSKELARSPRECCLHARHARHGEPGDSSQRG